MKCLILAAGYATRLYPLTKNYPKPLLDVGGRSILDRLIDDLGRSTLIDEYIVISNARFAGQYQLWAEKRTLTADQSQADSHTRTISEARQENQALEVEDTVRIGNFTILNDGTSSNETRLGAVRDIELALDQLSLHEDLLVMAADNVLTFSLLEFVAYARSTGTSCVMCHEEKELARLQKTAVITTSADGLITSYEEKPLRPKGSLAVPPFYYLLARDADRIPEALADGCGADAPGSFAAWLSRRVPMHAWRMSGMRYDIGDLAGYQQVQEMFMQ